MFSALKWMAFPERVLYQKAIQMFKTIRGNSPEYLRTPFTFATDTHAILLRSSSSFQLYTPKPHLEIYRYSGPSIWNSCSIKMAIRVRSYIYIGYTYLQS